MSNGVGYAEKREEEMAAALKKLLDRIGALNTVTYTRTLYRSLSVPVMPQNLVLCASIGFFVNHSTPFDGSIAAQKKG
jgi:hypothetical protein